MPPVPVTNFEIQNYNKNDAKLSSKNQPRFNPNKTGIFNKTGSSFFLWG